MTKRGWGWLTAGLALLPAAAMIPRAQQATPAITSAPAPTPATTPAPVPLLTARVVHRYPHDPAAFTEGLIWHDGALYESVGLEGRSEVRRVRLADGMVERRATIPASQFGEGLAAWGDQLVSLTWHDGVAHRWSAATLTPVGTARYTGEGWGLTADATSLIRSDGSATLTFHDPATLAVRRRVNVTVGGRALTEVNELEWVDGAILANVWHQPFLIRVDPADGHVTAVIDLRPIVAEVKARDPEAVANGIAWDAKGRRLFVTGKLWPMLFEIAIEG
ncbi:glutaminyl-peptide cyclotransferase [Sphingomonas oligophenolica]|uniref:Glutaminyl-peptide cyclotransferase n=1 Tax=Sphingomonas oligophenolica TaxID=301154 RepID=A0A502CNH6_9SPHN|nr:glutaminyl-peptide cyclotransferase [Sphingomonas oligophenolica]TPG13699.1 glutaminyl-peptide cyclotransferase [Sphingomonas oligophenolica]